MKDTRNIEMIRGFEIPLRILTEEESSMEVTTERIIEFGYVAGEDFLDATNLGAGTTGLVFGGFLLHKYPEIAKEIIEILNEEYSDCHGFGYLSIYDNCERKFFGDFSEFVNLTTEFKKEVNQVLIQVMEHYNDEDDG